MRAEYINQLDYSRSVFNFTTEAHHAWDDIMQERERNGGLRGESVDAHGMTSCKRENEMEDCGVGKWMLPPPRLDSAGI